MMRRMLLSILVSGILSVIATAHAQPHTHGPTEPPGPVTHDHPMVPITSEMEFLKGMLMHHQEAVDSAESMRQRTQREQMMTLAEEIIETQSHELELFRTWLADWYALSSPSYEYQEMMRDLMDLEPAEVDRVFLEDMIQHHLEAIRMARQYLEGDFERHPEAVEVANNIILTQHEELELMRGWLLDWYGVEVVLPEWLEGTDEHTTH